MSECHNCGRTGDHHLFCAYNPVLTCVRTLCNRRILPGEPFEVEAGRTLREVPICADCVRVRDGYRARLADNLRREVAALTEPRRIAGGD